MVGFIIVCLRFIIPQLYDSIRELSLMIPDIYKSIMSIFEHYRENSTDMFPGQIADIEPAYIAAYHAIDDDRHERYGIDQ